MTCCSCSNDSMYSTFLPHICISSHPDLVGEVLSNGAVGKKQLKLTPTVSDWIRTLLSLCL